MQMDLKSVVIGIVFFLFNCVISSSGCQERVGPVGEDVQLNFSSEQCRDSHTFSIAFSANSTGYFYVIYSSQYGIYPSFIDRVKVSLQRVNASDWHMSITLLNISAADGGVYRLVKQQSSMTCTDVCLYVLDLPEARVFYSSRAFSEGQPIEGEYIALSGKTAKILPNNSPFHVRMTWLLNDKLILPDDQFTVHEDTLIMWSVPFTFYGARVTYRAAVVGQDVSTSVTTRLFVVPKSDIEVVLHLRQTRYVVTEDSIIPDIKCDVTSRLLSHISWSRGEHLVSNDSVLSLGRVDRTMSGEYICTAVFRGLSKNVSLYISVNEKNEISTKVLSTTTGIASLASVVMGIVLCRKKFLQQWTHSDRAKTKNKRSKNAITYTALRRLTQNQLIYAPQESSASNLPTAGSFEMASFAFDFQREDQIQNIYAVPDISASHSSRSKLLQQKSQNEELYKTLSNLVNTETSSEYLDMSACRDPPRETQNQQLYERPDPGVTMEPSANSPGEHPGNTIVDGGP